MITASRAPSSPTHGFSAHFLGRNKKKYVRCGHTRPIRKLVMRADSSHGSLVASCSNDGWTHVSSLRDECAVIRWKMPIAGGPPWCAGWCDEFAVVVGTNRGSLHLFDLRKTGKDNGPIATMHPFAGDSGGSGGNTGSGGSDGSGSSSGGWKKQPIVSIYPVSANGLAVMSTLHEVGTVRMWGEGHDDDDDGKGHGSSDESSSMTSSSLFSPWFKKEHGRHNMKQLLYDSTSNTAVVTSSTSTISSFRVYSDIELSLRHGRVPPLSSHHTTPPSVLVKRPGMTTCSLQPLTTCINTRVLLGTVDEKSGGMCVIQSEQENNPTIPFEKIQKKNSSIAPVVAVMSWNLSKSRMCVMASRADGRVDVLAADHQ